MSFYDEMTELAQEMLSEFGAPGTLIRGGEATFDKKLGKKVATGNPLEIPVQASVGPIKIKDAQGREITQSVAVTLEKPLQGDKLIWGELTYIIGNVTALPLQGQVIAYMSEVS